MIAGKRSRRGGRSEKEKEIGQRLLKEARRKEEGCTREESTEGGGLHEGRIAGGSRAARGRNRRREEGLPEGGIAGVSNRWRDELDLGNRKRFRAREKEVKREEMKTWPEGFRSLAGDAVAGIAKRGRIPVIAGGSNSYIHAMMASGCDPMLDVFADEAPAPRHRRFRYRSCLLWVDVEAAVLAEHLDRRVDDMVGLGMVEELERYFAAGEWDRHPGLRKAIGVPEFAEYFRRRRTAAAYDDAIEAIKESTRRLAEEQVRKIKRLGEMGWPLKRVDATEAVAARLAGEGSAEQDEAWERDVLRPSFGSVEKFLEDESMQLAVLKT